MGDGRGNASADGESIPNSVDPNPSGKQLYKVESTIRVEPNPVQVRVEERWEADDAVQAITQVRDYYGDQLRTIHEVWEVSG